MTTTASFNVENRKEIYSEIFRLKKYYHMQISKLSGINEFRMVQLARSIFLLIIYKTAASRPINPPKLKI